MFRRQASSIRPPPRPGPRRKRKIPETRFSTPRLENLRLSGKSKGQKHARCPHTTGKSLATIPSQILSMSEALARILPNRSWRLSGLQGVRWQLSGLRDPSPKRSACANRVGCSPQTRRCHEGLAGLAAALVRHGRGHARARVGDLASATVACAFSFKSLTGVFCHDSLAITPRFARSIDHLRPPARAPRACCGSGTSAVALVVASPTRRRLELADV